MNFVVEQEYKKLERSQSSYLMLLVLRYGNLCVKAEPLSLLNAEIEYDGETRHFEEVAKVCSPEEHQFLIVPHDNDFLLPLSKAILKTHPEFKQEFVEATEKRQNEWDGRDETKRKLRLYMPEVNKERYDFLKDGIKVLRDQCSANLKKEFMATVARVANIVTMMSDQEAEEAKQRAEEINKFHTDHLETTYQKKDREIEEAYALYLRKEADQAAKQQSEQMKAAGTTFKMGKT